MFNYRTVSILLLLTLSALTGVLYLSCGSSKHSIQNVLLISIDTCRADYLSCYGYPRRTTPNLDQLAEDSIRFTNAYSPVPITLPAHSSLLTGTLPPSHGVRDNMDYKLDPSQVTLPELFKGSGFATGAIISAFVLDSQFGLDQGFDDYNDQFEKPLKTLTVSERQGDEASRLAMAWLDRHQHEHFFLFLHYYDPHAKYAPPEPFASTFPDNLYAGEIAYTDYCIGSVIRHLKKLGLYESTLIVVTGDHGEMLGEHGELDHMYFIYQSAIRVPLIFKLPRGHEAETIDSPVGIIDIVPTICSIMNIKTPQHVQGRNLTAYVKDNQAPDAKARQLYCESLVPTKYGASSLLGIVTDRWKYIQTTRPELYDLIEDPEERRNIIKNQPHQARVMRDRLKRLLDESSRAGGPNSRSALDEKGRRRLESLGYLSGSSVKEDMEFDQTSDDPKDLIHFHKQILEVVDLIEHDGFSQARFMCEKLLKQRPHVAATHLYMAKIAMAQHDAPGAVSYLNEAIRIAPDARTHLELGSALMQTGKTEDAVKHFQEVIRHKPHFHYEAYFNLGNALVKLGQTTDAIRHFEEAVNLNPEFVEAHNNLGFLLLGQNKTTEAIKHFDEAVQINPDYEDAHINFGLALSMQGKTTQAIEQYAEAIRINSENDRTHNTLGLAFARQGRLDEAVEHFFEAVRINPGSDDMQNNLGVALTNQRRFEEAAQHFYKALRINPKNAKAHENLGKILPHIGK